MKTRHSKGTAQNSVMESFVNEVVDSSTSEISMLS